ncbi:conserved hypothetical protein [Vibrio chagasii]|nr:conserved hypothetical protein [Vibrio chagasii]CAH6945594.1 conserved hypothetical protein [Vibrio chagasii]CAH6984330.1 conserved hypothetical protein [Vibrio chagasii]CAH7012797.1 conserved hypothetical protein [Vibrio chagasii]CAH7214940.1 conserved hypothetical protein [Vibrio chagasii]
MDNFKTWTKRSVIKSHEYRYSLQVEGMKQVCNTPWISEAWYTYFLPQMVLDKLTPEEKTLLGACILSNFMSYTVEVEHCIVNPIVNKISLGESRFFTGKEERMTCYGVFADEVYHAMFSYDLFSSLIYGGEIHKVHDFESSSKEKTTKILTMCDARTGNEKEVVMLALGVYSEVCIATQLTNIQRDTMCEPVYNSLVDHLDDEKRHAAIFVGLMRKFWRVSSLVEKKLFIEKIFAMFELNVSYMDRTWIVSYFNYIGKSELLTLLPVQKTEDKYKGISNFAERTSRVLFSELNRLGAWEIEELNKLLKQYNLSRVARDFIYV